MWGGHGGGTGRKEGAPRATSIPAQPSTPKGGNVRRLYAAARTRSAFSPSPAEQEYLSSRRTAARSLETTAAPQASNRSSFSQDSSGLPHHRAASDTLPGSSSTPATCGSQRGNESLACFFFSFCFYFHFWFSACLFCFVVYIFCFLIFFSFFILLFFTFGFVVFIFGFVAFYFLFLIFGFIFGLCFTFGLLFFVFVSLFSFVLFLFFHLLQAQCDPAHTR